MFWILLLPAVAPPAVPHLDVVRPQAITIYNQLYLEGVVEPAEKLDLKPVLDGVVKRVHVQESARVAKGDLLVELEDREARIELRRAEASLALARAQAKTADETQAARAKAEVDLAEANRDLAKLRLEQCQIRAPWAGRVQPMVREGQSVRAGETILAQLESVGPARVVLDVSRQDFESFFRPLAQGKATIGELGKTVLVKQGTTSSRGTIVSIADRLTGEKATARVVVEVPKANPAYGPGTKAEVMVRTHPGIKVAYHTVSMDSHPASLPFSNYRRGDPYMLYVVDANGKLQRRKVTPHPEVQGGEQFYSIQKGFEPGDRVVKYQMQVLMPHATFSAEFPGQPRFPRNMPRNIGRGQPETPLPENSVVLPLDVTRKLNLTDW
jgi:multidrug efflux system membrane fusion protein